MRQPMLSSRHGSVPVRLDRASGPPKRGAVSRRAPAPAPGAPGEARGGGRGSGGTFSAEYLRMLAMATDLRGLTAAPIFSAAGIDPAVLEQRGARVAAAPVIRAWQQIMQRLNDPQFGLRYVDAQPFGTADLLDYLLRSSATLRDALQSLVRYASLLSAADPRLNRILTEQAEGLLASISPPPRPPTFVETVEQALVNGLAEGDVTLTRLADHLGLSARTVQRRLREIGVSHRSLVRTLRLDIAARSLTGAGADDVSQGQIARALGYSGAGSFHRAFKSWAGLTPGQARARSRTPVPPR